MTNLRPETRRQFDSQFKENLTGNSMQFRHAIQTFAAQVKQTLLAQGMDETMAAAMSNRQWCRQSRWEVISRPTMPLAGAYQKAYDTAC